MHQWLKQFHYKELFLVGFYLSFIVITLVASVIDFAIANVFDGVLDLLFVGISLLFFISFLKTRNSKIAARAILWIASTIVFIFVYHSAFDMSIMFTLLLPIVAFILMPPREIFLNMSLYYAILITLFFHGYLTYEHHHILHNAKTISSYLIASLFVIAFGLFYNYAIEESHRALEKANTQKEILLKEIHHRIKNNLNIISSILGLQKLESNHPEIDRIVEQNRLRIESISLAHETLYRSDDLEKIDFAAYVSKLAEQILFSAAKEDQICLHVNAKSLTFPLEIMVKLGIILNELITNSLKYAFDNQQGAITISLERELAHYILKYHDSGTSHTNAENQDSLGLNLVSMTIDQMEGEMQSDPHNPYHYTIRFEV
jgi:two-component sensor histidine kinase